MSDLIRFNQIRPDLPRTLNFERNGGRNPAPCGVVNRCEANVSFFHKSWRDYRAKRAVRQRPSEPNEPSGRESDERDHQTTGLGEYGTREQDEQEGQHWTYNLERWN